MTRRRRHSLLVPCIVVLTLSAACVTSGGPIQPAPSGAPLEPAPAPGALRVVPPIAPINPDRPDVTNGTNIVETGLLQIESGVQHERLGSQRSLSTPVTLRIGLLEWLEARIGSDGFLHQADPSSSVSGAGNVQVGTKVRLFSDPGGVPVLSILPTVTLPIASRDKGLGSGDYDFTLVMLTGTDLGRTSHVDFNYGIGAIGGGEGHGRFLQHLVSVSASHSVTEQTSPYLEGYWFSREDAAGGPSFSIDAGVIQAFTARWAVDGGAGVGLTKAAPGLSLFAGMSVIVGDVLGDHGVIARQRKAARLQNRGSH